jgi:hypothetical protein
MPDGRIIKRASPETIQNAWKPAIQDAIAAYLTHFGSDMHSMYVRGSVAQGEATGKLSDLDLVAVVTSERLDTWLAARWSSDLARTLVQRYPFIAKLDAWESTLDGIWKSRAMRIALQTQAVCIYGTDLAVEFGPLSLGEDAFCECLTIHDQLVECLYDLERGRHVNIRSCCRWMMKHIVRAGFELVMERERCYTHDLYTCYESFARHYPSRQEEMRNTLELALNPTNDKGLLGQILIRWLLWLPNEIAAVRANTIKPNLAPTAADSGLGSHTPRTLA